MGYASKLGRARISASNPQAAGQCDRCGLIYTFRSLQWQFDWRGAALQNLRILVCRDCLDTPQPQLRAIVVPADPTPIINARVTDYVAAETNYSTTSAPTVYDPVTGIPIPSTTRLVTEDGQYSTMQATGEPLGLSQGAVMPLKGKIHYGTKLALISVSANGTTIITVTCSVAHGLATNGQVSIEGLANNAADGFYSVTVLSAMAFTYMTNRVIASGGLLTPTTNIITASVGLPLDFIQLPQTGGID